MMSNYYDVDAILAEEERVPVRFETDANGLGFLDSTAHGDLLKRDTKAELPIWLGTVLATRAWVAVETPKCFAHRFRTYLLADPTVINLRERSPYYYHVGLRLAAFVRDSKALVDTLVRSLSMRYKDILDKAQNSRNEDLSNLTRGMTELEQELFLAGHSGAHEMFRWKRRDCELLTSARRKRPRLN